MKRDVKQLSLLCIYYLFSLFSEQSCLVRVVTWRGKEKREYVIEWWLNEFQYYDGHPNKNSSMRTCVHALLNVTGFFFLAYH